MLHDMLARGTSYRCLRRSTGAVTSGKLCPESSTTTRFSSRKSASGKRPAVHFDRAARLADELKQTTDYANSRSNYWGCRFELDGIGICEIMMPELRRLGDILHEANWPMGERKVLVLIARVEACLREPASWRPAT